MEKDRGERSKEEKTKGRMRRRKGRQWRKACACLHKKVRRQ